MSDGQAPGFGDSTIISAETLISPEEVRRIADLANLDLSDTELDAMRSELGAILDYVRHLSEVDVEGVPPMDHVHDVVLPLRADEPRPSLPQDVALREAPNASSDGFAVPAFVDEG